MTAAPKRILVVDDDPEIRRLEETILIQDGFEVDTAEDGPRAIEKLRTTTYDGVVLDIGMPGMDGYEVARKIQQLDANKRTPLIMVTGSAERDAAKRGFSAGVVVFMNKPFSVASFRSAIHSAIG